MALKQDIHFWFTSGPLGQISDPSLTLKGGRADFDISIFTLNWSTLTPKPHFVQSYLKVASYFLSWGKNKNVTLGWGCYENTLETQNWYIIK